MKNILLTITLVLMVTTTFSQITNVGELKIEEGIEIKIVEPFTNNSTGSIINNGSIIFDDSYSNLGTTDFSPISNTTINGNLTTNGIFDAVINGETPGIALGYSQANVIGDLTLSSATINVTIEPSYLPVDGTTHTIITYSGSLTGTFDTVNIISTSGWFIDYSTSGEVNIIRDSVLDIENIDEVSFSVYPNPTSSFVNIHSKETIDKIELFDINGRLIFTKPNNSQIDISNLSVGIYMLKVVDVDGKSSTKKIIKN
jgi:hypothetical protein